MVRRRVGSCDHGDAGASESARFSKARPPACAAGGRRRRWVGSAASAGSVKPHAPNRRFEPLRAVTSRYEPFRARRFRSFQVQLCSDWRLFLAGRRIWGKGK